MVNTETRGSSHASCHKEDGDVSSAAVMAMIYPMPDVEHPKYIQDIQMFTDDSKWQTNQDEGTS